MTDRLFEIAMKVLVDGRFEVTRTPKANELLRSFMDRRPQRTSTATKRLEPFSNNLTKYS